MCGSEEAGSAARAELQSNFVPLHVCRLDALASRWRPGPPQRRACPTPSTCSGEGDVERSRSLQCLKNCFPVSARTEEGCRAPGGEEQPRQASSLLRTAGDAAVPARCAGKRDPRTWTRTAPPPGDRRSELLAVEENRNRTPDTHEAAKGEN